jgi:hypothetical protein
VAEKLQDLTQLGYYTNRFDLEMDFFEFAKEKFTKV